MSKYQLVPVLPTEQMGIAGCKVVSEMTNNTRLDHDEALACYKAMLEAAPHAVSIVQHCYNENDRLKNTINALLDALTPSVIDWVRCGIAVNGHLVYGSHPALEKLKNEISTANKSVAEGGEK